MAAPSLFDNGCSALAGSCSPKLVSIQQHAARSRAACRVRATVVSEPLELADMSHRQAGGELQSRRGSGNSVIRITESLAHLKKALETTTKPLRAWKLASAGRQLGVGSTGPSTPIGETHFQVEACAPEWLQDPAAPSTADRSVTRARNRSGNEKAAAPPDRRGGR
jgi:hypothetical protein